MENFALDTSLTRTPLKTLNRSFGCNNSATKVVEPVKPAYSSYAGANLDLQQARIDHLERERVDLSLQLHLRDEKERGKNILIKNLEQGKEQLEEYLENSKREMVLLKNQKEDLDLEVNQLSRQLDIQRTKTSSMEGLWGKMTSATRDLRRVEDELAATIIERDDFLVTMTNNTKIIDKLKEELDEAKKTILSLKIAREDIKATHEDQTNSLRLELSETRQTNTSLEDQNSNLIQEKEKLFAEKGLLETELFCLKQELQESRERELVAVKFAAETVNSSSNSGTVLSAEDRDTIDDLRESLRLSEVKRKQLHNTLQELRGNIRVFVRCRPFLKGDDTDSSQGDSSVAENEPSIKFNSDGTTLSLVHATRGTPQNFCFDQIFKPESTQLNIFREVSEFVQSALDGYRVCIFSYGQTGLICIDTDIVANV